MRGHFPDKEKNALKMYGMGRLNNVRGDLIFIDE